jgi:hypothetical protein
MRSSTLSVPVFCAALLAAGTSVSHAQPTDTRVLLVGVTKGSRYDARLTRALSEHLDRSGAGTILTDQLSSSERQCSSQDCLEPLAQKLDAQVLLTAIVQQSAASSFYIQIGLFDAVRRAPFSERLTCEQCGTTELIAKLSDASDRLLQQRRKETEHAVKPAAPAAEPRAASAEPEPPPVQPAESVVSKRAEPAASTSRARDIPSIPTEAAETKAVDAPQPVKVDRSGLATDSSARRGYSGERSALIGILTGLTIAGLSAGLSLHIDELSRGYKILCENPKTSIDQACVYVPNNKALYGIAYGVAAASLVGLSLTVFWPQANRKEHKEATSTVAQRIKAALMVPTSHVRTNLSTPIHSVSE